MSSPELPPKRFTHNSVRAPSAATNGSNDELSARDAHFRTEHLVSDLKRRSVHGGVITLLAQSVYFAIQITSIAVLARLLAPGDFGLIAMVTTVTGVLTLFRDGGLGQATVQKDDINHDQVSTLFWLNVGLGFALSILVVILAPGIAWIYGEPRLTQIAYALAATFVIGGFTIQHQALLQRQMRFVELAVIRVTSIGLGVAAALIGALYGLSYWALVVLPLVQTAVSVALSWVLCRWRPGKPQSLSTVKPLISFGGKLAACGFVSYFSRSLDNLLIGTFHGAASLGYYTRSYSLIMLPIGQINAPLAGVAVPALSRLNNAPEEFRRYFLRICNLICYATMPLLGVLAAFTPYIIALVLGPQWDRSARLFSILVIAAYFQPLMYCHTWIYIANGNSGRLLRWSTVTAVVLSVSFCIGIRWEAEGVAWAYAVAVNILVLPCILYGTFNTPIRFSDVLYAVVRPSIFGVALFIVLSMTVSVFETSYPLFYRMAISTGIVVAGICSFLIVPHFRRDVWSMYELLASLRGSRREPTHGD